MTARAGAYRAMQTPDMERRVSNIIRYGTVEETDYKDPKNPRVRVRSGKALTGWIPIPGRAGGDTSWSPLDKGEQVLIAAPGGDLVQAAVITSIYQNAHPAPDTSADRTVFLAAKDGARADYDRGGHVYKIDVPAGGKIVIQCGGSSIELSDKGIKMVGQRIDLNP